jgi:hypothetical protein
LLQREREDEEDENSFSYYKRMEDGKSTIMPGEIEMQSNGSEQDGAPTTGFVQMPSLADASPSSLSHDDDESLSSYQAADETLIDGTGSFHHSHSSNLTRITEEERGASDGSPENSFDSSSTSTDDNGQHLEDVAGPDQERNVVGDSSTKEDDGHSVEHSTTETEDVIQNASSAGDEQKPALFESHVEEEAAPLGQTAADEEQPISVDRLVEEEAAPLDHESKSTDGPSRIHQDELKRDLSVGDEDFDGSERETEEKRNAEVATLEEQDGEVAFQVNGKEEKRDC